MVKDDVGKRVIHFICLVVQLQKLRSESEQQRLEAEKKHSAEMESVLEKVSYTSSVMLFLVIGSHVHVHRVCCVLVTIRFSASLSFGQSLC